MAPILQQRQSNSRGDDQYQGYQSNYSSARTATIIVICVILILKLSLIAWIMHVRAQKREERKARGCRCFDDSDYYCTPWWYWSNDQRCHCPPPGVPLECDPFGLHAPPPADPAPPYPAYSPPFYNREAAPGAPTFDETLSTSHDLKKEASGERLLAGDGDLGAPETRVQYR